MSYTDATLSKAAKETKNKHSVFKFKLSPFGVAGGDNRKATCNQPGDHIFVAQLDQISAIYIKFDTDRNPWIRVIQGDVIKREFNKFFVFLGDKPTSTRRGSGILYVSNGPLVERRIRPNGIAIGDFCRRQLTATTTPQSLWTLLGQVAKTVGYGITAGSQGGTMIIKNTDSSNTLLLDLVGDSAGGSNAWFPISPGESLTIDLRHALNFVEDTQDAPAFSCDAGTCSFAVIFPYEFDLGQPGQKAFPSFAIE